MAQIIAAVDAKLLELATTPPEDPEEQPKIEQLPETNTLQTTDLVSAFQMLHQAVTQILVSVAPVSPISPEPERGILYHSVLSVPEGHHIGEIPLDALRANQNFLLFGQGFAEIKEEEIDTGRRFGGGRN